MHEALGALRDGLDAAADAGRPVTVWWRDDDAVAPGPRLQALMALADRYAVPLALAVIPARASDGLLRRCETEGVTILQHGVSHTNHEPAGKKAELGLARPADVIVAECVCARARLEGSRAFLPVMVPPWNRMRADLAWPLRRAGYAGLSLFAGPPAAGPLPRVDTHIDPVDWRGGGGLVHGEALAAMIRRALSTQGPIGLLTHHAVHAAAVDEFVAAFARLVAGHPGARWAAAGEVFALAQGGG